MKKTSEPGGNASGNAKHFTRKPSLHRGDVALMKEEGRHEIPKAHKCAQCPHWGGQGKRDSEQPEETLQGSPLLKLGLKGQQKKGQQQLWPGSPRLTGTSEQKYRKLPRKKSAPWTNLNFTTHHFLYFQVLRTGHYFSHKGGKINPMHGK